MRGTGQEEKYLTTGDPRRVSDRATQFLRREVRFTQA
jgi:glutamate racemase